MSTNIKIKVNKERLASSVVHFTFFPSKTYKRLRSIFKYLELLSSITIETTSTSTSALNSDKNNNNIEVIKCEGFDEVYGAFKLRFNSALGLREIEVAHNSIGFPSFEYTLSYADYAGAVVFKISANEHEFSVAQLLGEDYITGHEVDLAILEVEEYLRNTYGSYSDLKKLRELEEVELIRLHKIELNNIENGNKAN